MGECGKRVDALTVEEYVKLDELRLAEVVQMIVKRCITLGYALELVLEIYHNLANAHVKHYLHAFA